jgi:hypothetical protein
MFAQVKDDWGKLGKFNSSIETMCFIMLAKHCGMKTPVHHTETDGTKNGTTYGDVIESLANETIAVEISASGMPKLGATHLTLSDMQTAVFCLSVSADKLLTSSHANYSKYIALVKQVLDYCLGENKFNRSFLVGYNPAGKVTSTYVLHGPAQGFWEGPKLPWLANYPGSDELGDFTNVPPRHICYGGLVSPSYEGEFNPTSYDPARVEVGPTYQKGFEGSLARMVEKLGASAGTVLPNFPSPEPTDGKEYYVRVKELKSTSNSVQLSALIVNHSAWPAVLKENMSFRYYFTKEAGTTVTVSKQDNTQYALSGVVISTPKLVSGNTYYVEASFPNIKIYPGGRKENPDSQLDGTKYPRYPHYEKEIVFTLTSSGSWDNSNDWSHKGVGQDATSTGYSRIENIPVFDSNIYLAGKYPSEVTSTESPVESDGMVVYPNPTDDVLSIRIENNYTGTYNIKFYDIAGLLVQTSSFSKNTSFINNDINIDQLTKGIYTLEIKNGETSVFRKILKK